MLPLTAYSSVVIGKEMLEHRLRGAGFGPLAEAPMQAVTSVTLGNKRDFSRKVGDLREPVLHPLGERGGWSTCRCLCQHRCFTRRARWQRTLRPRR